MFLRNGFCKKCNTPLFSRSGDGLCSGCRVEVETRLFLTRLEKEYPFFCTWVVPIVLLTASTYFVLSFVGVI